MPTATKTKDLIPDQAQLEQGRTWLRGVEAFSVGRWNWEKYGEEWTREKLAAMVEAFAPTWEEVIPVVTTNHGEDKRDGQQQGFIGRLYLNADGTKILEDVLIDDALFDDVKAARYRRPSQEIRRDFRDKTGKVWPYVISASSFQGGLKMEAVRDLKPLHRTAAEQAFSRDRRPLHYRDGGTVMTITFDEQKGKPMDPELKAMLEQIMAGMSQLMKAMPKEAMPSEEMEQKDKDKKPVEMEAQPAAAPATVTATPAVVPTTPAPVLATQPEERDPKVVTLKYAEAEEVTALKAKVAELERGAQLAAVANTRAQERADVRGRVAKFAEAGNMRIMPAEVDKYTDLALAIPATGQTLKFSEGGKTQEMSPRDLWFADMEKRPDQTPKTVPQGRNLGRPEPTKDVLQFAEQVQTLVKEKGVSHADAWAQVAASIPDEDYDRIVHPEQFN